MIPSLVILVAAESDPMRNLILRSLKSQGYGKVIGVADGKAALDAMMESKVDLVVSDVNMPKVNGMELLRALRNHSAFKEIPFITLTADTSDTTFKAILENGADGYIEEPFTELGFGIKIQQIIKRLKDRSAFDAT
jgi:two-component system chemotaxis response regulator CheY